MDAALAQGPGAETSLLGDPVDDGARRRAIPDPARMDREERSGMISERDAPGVHCVSRIFPMLAAIWLKAAMRLVESFAT